MIYFKSEKTLRETVKKAFLQEKRAIAKILPGINVQHVGSTAIPNSLTKGDLDIQVRVKKKDFAKTVKKLMKLYKKDTENRRTKTYVGLKKCNGEIPIGIQVTVIGLKEDDFSKLRDILLSNPKHQKEFDSLKKKYNGKTMSEYRRAKAKFFNRLKQTSEFKKLVTEK